MYLSGNKYSQLIEVLRYDKFINDTFSVYVELVYIYIYNAPTLHVKFNNILIQNSFIGIHPGAYLNEPVSSWQGS